MPSSSYINNKIQSGGKIYRHWRLGWGNGGWGKVVGSKEGEEGEGTTGWRKAEEAEEGNEGGESVRKGVKEKRGVEQGGDERRSRRAWREEIWQWARG